MRHHHQWRWPRYLSLWITVLCAVSDTVLQTTNGLSSSATFSSNEPVLAATTAVQSAPRPHLDSDEETMEEPLTLATRRGGGENNRFHNEGN